MTPGLALFLTFAAIDVVLGIIATRVVAKFAGGPSDWWAHLVPILTGFVALGVLGHSLGAHIGPTVSLYGFQVALFGDIAIGLAGALAGALAQAAVVRARRRRSSAA